MRFARKLPTSPHIFGRLGMLLSNLNADLEDIVKLASVDAGLTARVIRMSNSVFFRGEASVNTLEDAISRVGFREIHKIVGVAMTDQVFQSGLPVYHLSGTQVWENSVITALATEHLASIVGEDEGLAYTIGLLRPVGKLVLDTMLEIEQPGVSCPDSETFDLIKWERAWAGITSNEVGALVMEEWRMTSNVYLGVKNHYSPDAEAGVLGALLHLGCWVTHQMGKGFKVEARQWSLSDDILQRAGLSADVVQASVGETEKKLSALKLKIQIKTR